MICFMMLHKIHLDHISVGTFGSHICWHIWINKSGELCMFVYLLIPLHAQLCEMPCAFLFISCLPVIAGVKGENSNLTDS